jgi:hypothetical protein
MLSRAIIAVLSCFAPEKRPDRLVITCSLWVAGSTEDIHFEIETGIGAKGHVGFPSNSDRKNRHCGLSLTIRPKTKVKTGTDLKGGGPESCITNKQNQCLILSNFPNGA